MKRLVFVLLTIVAPPLAYADSHDVYGLWLTEAGDGYVEVKDCGNGTPCGTLAWVDPSKSSSDLDSRNADKTLRDRPLMGIPIIWGYEKAKQDWRSGKIYNPEDGKSFSSSVRRLDDGTLRVKGCIGPICITNSWTPISQISQNSEAPQ